jgi:hypothetical protein
VYGERRPDGSTMQAGGGTAFIGRGDGGFHGVRKAQRVLGLLARSSLSGASELSNKAASPTVRPPPLVRVRMVLIFLGFFLICNSNF